MDPCRTGANLANSRAMIRSDLGVPRAYANKMSANSICSAFKNCKQTNILPPMDLHSVGNRTYLIDPRSPISVNDYIVLFGKGDLKKVAKKVGLVHLGLSRNIIKAGIIDMLKSLRICEPIELPAKRIPKNTTNLNGNRVNSVGNSVGNTGNTGNRVGNSIGNMNLGGNTGNRVGNSVGITGNLGRNNLGNTGNRLNMNNSFSSNRMPPVSSSKRFVVHPSKFRQSNSSRNERIRELIKKYHYNRNPRHIRNYSPNSNNDEFDLFRHILNNDSINDNKKFFKIRNRVKVPSPKKETVEPTSDRASQIAELTKAVKNISNQIGSPTDGNDK